MLVAVGGEHPLGLGDAGYSVTVKYAPHFSLSAASTSIPRIRRWVGNTTRPGLSISTQRHHHIVGRAVFSMPDERTYSEKRSAVS